MMDLSCLFAALLFVTSNLVYIAFFVGFHNRRSNFDYSSWKELEPDNIQEEWAFRRDSRPLELAAGIINAIAWFCLCIPILQVAWILSCGGKRLIGLHCAVAAMALAGSFSESVARLLYIGSTNAMEWLSSDFNLNNWLAEDSNDQIGWRTLEVVYIAMMGLLLWIDAFEWLALFGVLTLVFVSVRSQHPRLFTMRWAWLGAIIAVLCIIDFAADILRFASWRTFASVAMLITALNRLLLLPAWLIMLARQLPPAKQEFYKQQGAVVAAPTTTEMGSSRSAAATESASSSGLT